MRTISDEVILDTLKAWEQWTGTTAELYRDLGIKKGQLSSIIRRAKRLVKEGAVVECVFRNTHYTKRKRKKKVDRKKELAAETANKLKRESWSLRQVAAVLNSVPTTALKKGKFWHPEMVRRLLKREKSES